MTAAQRRASNRRNAQKSTGPKTAEGKERTRQNALKHGLCAEQVVLSIENADKLQEQFDGWVEQYQPVGPGEFAMVEEIAKNHLKLQRCARREAAVIELQVVAASRAWSYAQEDRVLALKSLIATDPDRALRELLRFGAGRRFLTDRWERLGHWFLEDGYCNAPALVEEAVRLLGGDPQQLATGPLVAYSFALCCAGARPTPEPGALGRLFSDAMIHPEYLAEFGRALPPPEVCREEVRGIVTQQLETLKQIGELEREQDGLVYEMAELTVASVRDQIPADGPETKHALRYEAQARSALHRALKELDRLQNERFAVEAEADAEPDVVTDAPAAAVPSVARNEPDTPPAPPSSRPVEKSCDGSTGTHPEPATECGVPTPAWLRAHPRVAPQERPWDAPVVGPGGADSPPA